MSPVYFAGAYYGKPGNEVFSVVKPDGSKGIHLFFDYSQAHQSFTRMRPFSGLYKTENFTLARLVDPGEMLPLFVPNSLVLDKTLSEQLSRAYCASLKK